MTQPSQTPVETGDCDVLVIGGGPGGSSAAARLAERGRHVVVLEKARHPRFHIGESLLPANLPVFEQLGVADAVRRIGLHKPGAEFVSDFYDKSNIFMFASATHLVANHSYQVRRAEFDKLLFENCRARGARAHEGMRVTDVALTAGERCTVTAVDEAGQEHVWRPRFVVDASGRDTVLSSKLGMKSANKRNNSAAVFGHFHGIDRRPGEAEGVITIHLVDEGWFWMIPLPDGLFSVGYVSNQSRFKQRGEGIDGVFWGAVKQAPSVAARMAAARATGPLTATGNYSYSSSRSGGDRFILVGDAFAFVDPIFSSGVMLAMTTGVMAADVVDRSLDDPRRGAAALQDYERQVRRATGQLAWLIYRINDPVMRFMLMHPNNRFGMRDGLIALLAGQFFKQPVRTRFSMLVFKTVYHALRLSGRHGPRQPAALARAG